MGLRLGRLEAPQAEKWRAVLKRSGECAGDNAIEQTSTIVFAVARLGCTSDLPIERSTESDRYVQNLDDLGFLEELDRKSLPFNQR
jgi:hypothetical protein